MDSKYFVDKANSSITFRVSEKIKDKAQKVAHKENRSLSYIAERALMRELKLHEQERK